MLVLNLPFKALMFLTLMRPSLVLFLVLWLKLVKDFLFFFSSRRRHTIYIGDWSSDVCSSDLEPAVPELVQHEERRGRIRAPAAEARSQGDALANSKAGTEPRAGGVLQSASGPHREIGLGCEVLRALRPLDPPVVPHADLGRVGGIDELKEGLQLVIAVGTPARHMEKEIQLGGRRPARVAAGLHGCQSSTRSRTRTASRLSVNRAGSISAPTAT